MIIGSIKLVHMVVHKYQCHYGPTNLTNVIKDITQNHNVVPKKIGHQWKSNPIKDWPQGYVRF
jgi:hypothetical protein